MSETMIPCRMAAAGQGVCDMCAAGHYEQCRYLAVAAARASMDRTPAQMREDALMWARAEYPAVAVGRYRDAADQIERMEATTMSVLRLEIAKLELQSGDILVLKLPPDMAPENVQSLQQHLSKFAAMYQCRAITIDAQMDLSVVRPTTEDRTDG